MSVRTVNDLPSHLVSWYQCLPAFLIVFLGTAGFAVMIPSMPILLAAAESPFFFGVTQSAISLASLVGASLLGWYSDIHGMRAAWLVYVLLMLLGNAPLLFDTVELSRIGFVLRMNPGVTRTLGAATVAYLVPCDQTEQARLSSLMGAFFAAGFASGAPLGGWLSRYGHVSNVAASIFIALVHLIVVLLCFPQDNRSNRVCQDGTDTDVSKAQVGVKQNPARALLQLWRESSVLVRGLLIARFFVGMARQLVISTFQLLTQQRFGMTAEEFGYMISAIGLCFLIVNAFVVPWLFKSVKVSQQRFFVVGCVLLCLARLGISAAPRIVLVLVCDLFVALGDGLVSSSGTTLLSNSVSASQHGLILGASGSIEIAAGVLAPVLSGWLFQNIGDFAPAAVAALACAIAAVMVTSAMRVVSPAAPDGKKDM
eukprot:TRINITY_DN23807_c0_g1_i2.p1 TRINITY_DN23807_c0_g1~~TRINITY_DN23807_c0_g1_i2.p1  ORF type:complete len:426 (+),score=43.89 TRINITY_DN23807_c0_g1_i2:51-1328(+)